MLTLIVPSYGGGPNIERTIASCKPYCDEVVIISTALFPQDLEHFKSLTPKVVELPWNYVFLHGHGSLHNQGTQAAKNDWLLLLGVAETIAETYGELPQKLRDHPKTHVFRCNHVNDPNQWKRIWNRQGGPEWSGIIHEEIYGGMDGGLIFRMQDTPKVPRDCQRKSEAFRYIKALSYNWLYYQLLVKPERLGAANAGWLEFVRGSRGAVEAYIEQHGRLLEACIEGDLGKYLHAVDEKIDAGMQAQGVSFQPQGT